MLRRGHVERRAYRGQAIGYGQRGENASST
jgi:hypothetical protein